MLKDLYGRSKDCIQTVPLLMWVLLGFFAAFLAFFVAPIFYDPSQHMRFPQYIRALPQVGADYRVIVAASSDWFQSRTLPTTLYPPLTLLFFWPLTLVSRGTGYKLLTLAILGCYVLIAFIIPVALGKEKRVSAFLMLVFVTGMLSYGLQFEVERGQWNVIACALSFSAIFLFHRYPRARWLAYLLFIVSVQLKLYPAIFVFALVDSWRDWGANIKRIAGLGLASIAALFMFGFDPVLRLTQALNKFPTSNSAKAHNLSISSFVLHLLSLPGSAQPAITWMKANTWLPQAIFLALFVACFASVVLWSYKRETKGLNPRVLMVLTIGALIIPAVSYDYKLAVLPAAIALWFPTAFAMDTRRNTLASILLAFLFSFSYASLLFPPTNKPPWLAYNLPVLLLLLVIVVAADFVLPADVTADTTDSVETNDHGRDWEGSRGACV